MSAHFKKAAENHCEFEDRTDRTALIALQGPKAFDVLARAGADAAKLVPYREAGIDRVLVEIPDRGRDEILGLLDKNAALIKG